MMFDILGQGLRHKGMYYYVRADCRLVNGRRDVGSIEEIYFYKFRPHKSYAGSITSAGKHRLGAQGAPADWYVEKDLADAIHIYFTNNQHHDLTLQEYIDMVGI